MTQPPHIAAALAYANDEATPAQLASLGPHPERAALAILAEAQATQPEEATAAALETIARLLQYVVGPRRKHTPCRSYARGIELRTVALLWVIRPDYLAGRSLDATAKGMGI